MNGNRGECTQGVWDWPNIEGVGFIPAPITVIPHMTSAHVGNVCMPWRVVLLPLCRCDCKSIEGIVVVNLESQVIHLVYIRTHDTILDTYTFTVISECQSPDFLPPTSRHNPKCHRLPGFYIADIEKFIYNLKLQFVYLNIHPLPKYSLATRTLEGPKRAKNSLCNLSPRQMWHFAWILTLNRKFSG